MTTSPTIPDRGTRDLNRAWLAVVLVPVFFLLAMAVGEGVVSLFGYDAGSSYPWWLHLLVAVLAPAVLALPGVAAYRLGRRASREGRHAGLLPAFLGAALCVAAVVMTVVTEVGDALRG